MASASATAACCVAIRSVRLQMALDIAASAKNDLDFMQHIEWRVGNSVLAAESVPAAIGLFAYAQGDPLRTISLGASMGNDTDTIATMAGALCGALVGARALPAALRDEFLAVNEPVYGLRALADALLPIAQRRLAGSCS